MSKAIVLDIETTFQKIDNRTDPSPYNPLNKLVSVGVMDALTGEWEYLFFHHTEKTTDLDEHKRLQGILDSAELIIGHNLKFDMSWLYEAGFTYSGKMWDTMIFEYVNARGLKPVLSLAACATRYGLSEKLDIFKQYMAQGYNTDQMPMKELEEYGVQDIQTTLELYNFQQTKIATDDEVASMLPAINLSMEVLKVLIQMERDGIAIDQAALKTVEIQYREELARLEHIMNDMVAEVMGHRPINLASPEHLSWVIYSRKVTDKKAWAETFNIGTEERNAVKKRKYPKRMGLREFKQAVSTGMETLYRQEASQCEECYGKGFIRKTKKDGTLYARDNKCKCCDATGFIYTDTEKIAGFKVQPLGSLSATVAGFATDKVTINALIATGKLKGNAQVFLECLQRYSAVSVYLNSFVEGIQRALRPDSIIHPNFNQCLTATGRLSSSAPNCFSDDTEVLTEEGWKLFKDLTKSEKLAQYDLNTKEITFALPLAYQEYYHQGKMVHIQKTRYKRQPAINLLLTPDHTCYLKDRKTGKLITTTASAYPKDALQIQAGYYAGENTLSPDVITLMCAFQADGHIRADGIVEFTFKKQRKIDRLVRSLQNQGIPHRVTIRKNGTCRISISRKDAPEYFSKDLNLDTILALDQSSLNTFTEELFLWDGCGGSQYLQKKKRNVDIAQICCILTGKTAKLRQYKEIYHTIDVTEKEGNLTSNTDVLLVDYASNVYCVTMPLGTVIVRRNGVVAITGQCQNMPRGSTFPVRKAIVSRWAKEGGVILESDFSGLEYRTAVMLARCPAGLISIRDALDRHSITAEIMFGKKKDECDPKEWKELRQQAKADTFAPLYGSNSSDPKRAAYREAFFKEHYGITQWHEKLLDEACKTHKVQTPSGRIFAFPNARRLSADRVSGKTQIVNYPVQSFATADIAWVVILDIYQQMIEKKVQSKLILQVHDSIVADIHPEEKEVMLQIFRSSFEKAAELLKQWFNYDTDVPIGYEMAIGSNLMEKKDIV